MSGHAPGPWARGTQDGEEIILAPSLPPRTRVICHVFWPNDSLVQGANADFIVRACNSHDELLEALKACVTQIRIAYGKHNPTAESAESVIAKAEAAE